MEFGRDYEINHLKKLIKQSEKDLVRKREELIRLEDSEEITNGFLYHNIKDLLTISEKKEKYTYILGGDGRSSAWDETREGNVCYVTIKENYYITSQQEEIIRDYVKRCYNADHIKIGFKK